MTVPDKKPSWRDHTITAAELKRQQFEPVSYVVPGLIPEGLAILAGRPKVGKSWLALDVAVACASGRICLGDCQPEEGDVLYAALEDNPRRLQRRIDKILRPHTDEWPEQLTLADLVGTSRSRRCRRHSSVGRQRRSTSTRHPRHFCRHPTGQNHNRIQRRLRVAPRTSSVRE